jgi:hypothetical protein
MLKDLVVSPVAQKPNSLRGKAAIRGLAFESGALGSIADDFETTERLKIPLGPGGNQRSHPFLARQAADG